MWARTDDRSKRTAKARAASPASLTYWERKVAGERPDLDPAERRLRAEHLWKANQARMALKASQARRRRAAERRARGGFPLEED
jgi:hypothetical protein